MRKIYKVISCMKSQVQKRARWRIIASRTEVKAIRTFVVWSLMTVASLFDARSYRIPNSLILLGYTASFMMAVFEHGSQGISIFIISALWPILLLYLLYLLGALGAGDIKLFSVMATMVGVRMTLRTICLSIILGGIAAIIICLYERQIVKRKLHFSFYIVAAFFLLQLQGGVTK